MSCRTITGILFLILISGCVEKPLTGREKGVVGGAVAGAGAGAGVGAVVDGGAGVAVGAVAGGVVGAVTGGLIGESIDNYDETVAVQGEVLDVQEQEKLRQEKEIEDIRRQEYFNEQLRKTEGVRNEHNHNE